MTATSSQSRPMSSRLDETAEWPVLSPWSNLVAAGQRTAKAVTRNDCTPGSQRILSQDTFQACRRPPLQRKSCVYQSSTTPESFAQLPARSFGIPSVAEGMPDSRLSPATKDLLFGSIAGMCAKLFEHPFDLVKVRLQTQTAPAAAAEPAASLAGAAGVGAGASVGEAAVYDGATRYNGAFDCFARTIRNEGILGLYRGLSMPVLGAIAENATLFFTYNAVLRTIHSMSSSTSASGSGTGTNLAESSTIGQLTVAAAAAGAATSLVLTPVELVKCRMQVQMIALEAKERQLQAASAGGASHASATVSAERLKAARRNLEGPVQIVTSTLRSDGLRGLWLGQTGTLLRETGGGIAWFLSFELATRAMVQQLQQKAAPGPDGKPPHLTKKDLASTQLILAGGLSGVMYNVVLFPADSVKSTMQTERELAGGAATKSTGFVETFRKIHRSKGIKGLYAGCGITCLRSAPSSALIFLLYNRLEQLAERHGL